MHTAASANQSSARTFRFDSHTIPWITPSDSAAAAAMDQRIVINLTLPFQALTTWSNKSFLLLVPRVGSSLRHCTRLADGSNFTA